MKVIKEFVIVFGQVLVMTLLTIFSIAFFIVPCIIETPYFVIPWIIFTISLYVTILVVLFIDPHIKDKNI